MDDITIHVTSSLTSSDRRVSPSLTISEFKKKMEFVTGIPPNDQKLWLYKTRDSKEKLEMEVNNGDDALQLSLFSISSLSRIHIENTNPSSEFIELQKDLLPKQGEGEEEQEEDGLFKLDESKYDSMSNTVKKWKQEKKLGKYDPNYAKKLDEAIELNKSKASNFKIGDRCKISKSGELDKLGCIKYIGQIPEIDKKEIWVGVQLDEPLGKNDGSIKGHRYFQCRFGYGSFVKPAVVEVGDFQEEEINFNDSEDEL